MREQRIMRFEVIRMMVLVPLRNRTVQLLTLGVQHEVVGDLSRDRMLERPALVRLGNFCGRDVQTRKALHQRGPVFCDRINVVQDADGKDTADAACDLERELLLWRQPIYAAGDDSQSILHRQSL